MKFYPKLKQYKASNLVYDMQAETAHSYEWYLMARRFNGLMVLNRYSYSPTTARHAVKLIGLFEQLGIAFIQIDAPEGLQNLTAAREMYMRLIAKVGEEIRKPRSHAVKNEERRKLIRKYSAQLALIIELESANA